MEPKSVRLGGSLEVPSVQELAREQLGTVPPRYVRPDQDHPIISDNSSLPQVPIIDLQTLLSGDFKDLELEKLHHACKEWGFFQALTSTYPLCSPTFCLSHSYIPWTIPSQYIQISTDIESYLIRIQVCFTLMSFDSMLAKQINTRIKNHRGPIYCTNIPRAVIERGKW